MQEYDISLESVDGIGPARLEALQDAGVESVVGLLETSSAELADASGINEGTIESFQANARPTPGNDESKSDNGETDLPWSQNAAVETTTVAFSVDPDEALHLVHIVLETATQSKQQLRLQRQDASYRLAMALMASIASGSAPGHFELELSAAERDALQLALLQGVDDYGNRHGISGMYGTFKDLKDQLSTDDHS